MSIWQFLSVIFLFPLGIAMGVWSVILVRRAHQSENWPCVYGKILKSEVNYYRRHGHHWDWIVSYRYHVNDFRYVSDTVYFGTSLALDDAISITERFQLNTEIKVYFKPDEPRISVLIPGITPHTYSLLFIGPLFIWAGSAPFGFFVL